jgi:hypothetical protein
MNFTLQPDAADGDTLLSAMRATLGGQALGADKPTKINLALANGADLALAEGEEIILIAAWYLSNAYEAGEMEVVSSTGKAYSFTLSSRDVTDDTGLTTGELVVTLDAVGAAASVDPVSAAFDKGAPADAAVTLSPGDFAFTALQNGETVLTEGTDYTKDGNAFTIKKEYLASLANGEQVLTFVMDGGPDPTLTVTVSGSAVTPDGGNASHGSSSNCNVFGVGVLALAGLAIAAKKK